MIYLSLLKVFLPATVAFFVGIAITPILTNWLYKNKMWKKKPGKISPDGRETPIFNELHKDKDVGTPRMGGIVIWGSVFVTTILFWLITSLWPGTEKFNFLSRNQTWLPLFTLLVGSLVGLIDDWRQVKAEQNCKKTCNFRVDIFNSYRTYNGIKNSRI